MKSLTVFLSLLLLSLAVLPCFAATQQLSWQDLRPVVTPIDDPFLHLSDEQLFELGTLARYRERADLTVEQMSEVNQINRKLSSEGLNVEWLFSKREQVKQYRKALATTANAALGGREFEIPGFITPIEFDDQNVTRFFLVPTSGACIHTPPPPANQIVLVDFPQGYPFNSLHIPVWIKGEMVIESDRADVTYVDGQADIETVYKMTAMDIRPYE